MRRLAVSLLALGTLLAAGDAFAASLGEVLADVYRTSPRLAAARAELRSADEEVPLARAGGRPQLQAQSSQGIGGLDDKGKPTSGFSTSNTVQLTQPIYTGGALRARLKRATEAVAAGRARLALVEQEVLLATVGAYAGVTFERARLGVAQGNEVRHRQELEAARQRFRFGDTTTTDIAQAESRLARATADRLAAEGDLALAVEEFARLVGAPPAGLEPLPECPLVPTTLDAAQEFAATHPALVAAEREVNGARAAVDVARAATRPRLSVSGQAGFVDQKQSDVGQYGSATISAVVTIPLYQGGGEHARIRQSKQGFTQRRYELDDVRRSVARDIATAWRSRATTMARLPTIELQLRAARIALAGVRQEALIGVRAVIDVLDAEADVFAAEITLERSRRDALLAGWTLAAAAGRLGAAELALPVELYDPEIYSGASASRWFGTGDDLPRSE